MIYRNSIVTPGGYLYSLVILQNIPEIYGKEQPACLHDGEGLVIFYNDILLDAYGPDYEFNTNRKLLKQLGYTMLDESTYGYFSWYADEPIHINHTSPYIYWDSTNGEAATEGIVVTKLYTPQAGDVSPFQGTAIVGVQSTAATNTVVGGGEYYFEGCTYLREVVMHNAEYFGPHCFDGCTSLQWMDIASAATFGEDCFANGAGAYRGVISAASKSTVGEPWVLTDIPASLRAKGWKIINHDGSELSDYWQVDIDGGLTVTANPAWTTLGELESNFAASDTEYALTVSGFEEGQSLAGWYIGTKDYGGYVEDSTNPKSFTFTGDTYIVPLTEMPPVSDVYQVSFQSNDGTYGSVYATLAGKEISSPCDVMVNDEVTFTAIPAEGYHFVQWSDGDEHQVKYKVIDSSYDVTAIFAADEEEPKKEVYSEKEVEDYTEKK